MDGWMVVMMMIFLSLPIPLANPGEPGTASRDEAKKTGSGFRVDWTPSAPGPWHLGNLQVTPRRPGFPTKPTTQLPDPGGAVAGDPAGGAHLHPPIGGPEPAAGQRFHEAPKAPPSSGSPFWSRVPFAVDRFQWIRRPRSPLPLRPS